MKNLHQKFYIFILAAFVLFLFCQNDIEHNFNDSLVIWVTDSFTVEVENSIFMEKMQVRKKGWGDTFDNFEKKIKTDTRNLFVLTDDDSSESFMLESWTGDAYLRKAIIVKHKVSGKVETQLTEREYSDIGTSGIEIYIRNNKLIKIIELVY